MQSQFPVGSRVRLTAKFLKSTGQHAGGEGLSNWRVQHCECGLCSRGEFVATDERNIDDDGQRHIAISNLQAVR